MKKPLIEQIREEIIKHKTYQVVKKSIPSEETDPLNIFGLTGGISRKINHKILKKDTLSFLKKFSPTAYKNLESMSETEKILQMSVYEKFIAIILSYERTGKITFRVREKFSELLSKTDFPENIGLNQIAFPFPGFFLEIEGSYIEYIEEEGHKINEGLIYISVKKEEPNVYFSLNMIEESEGKFIVPWSVDVELKETDTLLCLFNKLVEENKKKQIESKKIGEIIGILSNKEEIKEIEKIHEKIKENVRTLINLILYINHINEDIIDISPVPEKLKQKRDYYQKLKNEKKIEKIESQLKIYPRVYLVGQKTSEIVEREIKTAGSPKRPHWRRGHIRYYDPEKERKRKFKKQWTFVRPTLVKGKTEEAKEYVL